MTQDFATWDHDLSLQTGMVHLVGAGPGRKDWLTIEAKKLLQQADLIAYDDLIHPEIFDFAGAKTQLLAVGYRAHGLKKDELLHPCIIDYAKAGKVVVRLKSGDPMLYGRAWEEIAILEQHAIPWSIVPGISVLFGAAAAVPLPLTHRGVSAGLKIMAGNHSDPKHDLQETTAVYMPRNKIKELCERLINEGRPPEQAAVYIQAVSSSLQDQHFGTLTSLPEIVASKAKDLPGIVIIGDVVSLAANQPHAWHKPLAHCRILFLRLSDIESTLVSTLKQWGADCISYPYLQRKLSCLPSEISSILLQLKADDMLVLSSAYSVDYLQKALMSCRIDQRQLSEFSVMSIGESCREAVVKMGWQVPFHFRELPKQNDLLALVHKFAKSQGFHYLGESITGQRLQAAWPLNSRLMLHTLYSLQYHDLRINAPEPHLVIAPNQKSAEAFFATPKDFDLDKISFAVMGEKTKRFLQSQGVTRILCSQQPNYASMLKLIKNWANPFSAGPKVDATRKFI